MTKIAIQSNESGTGTFTIAVPNSNSNRTFTQQMRSYKMNIIMLITAIS